jgi:glutamate dehydrogenase (NADP+)
MKAVQDTLDTIKKNYPEEQDFYQAVSDVFESVVPYLEKNKKVIEQNVLNRMVEPDRIIQFRVTWFNQKGEVEVNRGWRVQFNNAMGAYKGGFRFHSSAKLDTFKFLGFEQTFKNALTGLPMGGGKGGSDFDPKGRSDADVHSFCQAFMLELHKHIGPARDVPAGDIGVGSREIGYLFGTYKKLTDRYEGVLTGKGPGWGGSHIRKEATGYGSVYFLEHALEKAGQKLEGQRCAVSGAGNVALYTAEKLLEKNAKVISMSDSDGTIYFKDGMSEDQLKAMIDLKEVNRGRLSEFKTGDFDYSDGKEPWDLECDIAIPSATQNEIGKEDAEVLKRNGVKWICEAANMPLTSEATEVLCKSAVILPAKAVNAGGVAVSGLERTQNALHQTWKPEKVNKKLQEIMCDIHDLCVRNSVDQKNIDYIQGANIAGFKQVAEAMIAYGS